MWVLRVMALSKTTPRFLAEEVGSTVAMPIWMGVSGEALRNLEWMGRNSVLSSLSLSEFRAIQHRISAMHASRLVRVLLYCVGSGVIANKVELGVVSIEVEVSLM